MMDPGIVADDPDLLDMMILDSANQADVWKPQRRWYDYALRIRRELEKNGLTDFRTNQNILKGFDAGGGGYAAMLPRRSSTQPHPTTK